MKAHMVFPPHFEAAERPGNPTAFDNAVTKETHLCPMFPLCLKHQNKMSQLEDEVHGQD